MGDEEQRQGFIKLFRKMTSWEWYSDIVVKTVFIHCLLKANYVEKRWRGYTIKRGQFITSYPNLAKECGITVSQARRAISTLCRTGEITHKAQAKYSVITVIEYESYQSNNRLDNSQGNSQATGKQHQHKNIKNDKEYKEYKKEPNPYVDINTMSITDFNKYDEWNRQHGIEG